MRRGLIREDLWSRCLPRVGICKGLTQDEVQALRELVTLFIAEKDFLPSHGYQLGEGQVLSIAIQACLPILKLDLDHYHGFRSIIILPESYRERRSSYDEGLVHEWEEEISGELLALGPVVLAWSEVKASSRGYQVVIHEMAHAIDGLNGQIDGMPPLPRGQTQEWKDTFTQAYGGLEAEVQRRWPRQRAGRVQEARHSLDEYALTDPGEFFAVACEAFFGNPVSLRFHMPGVYGLLVKFFKQDPAGRRLARPD